MINHLSKIVKELLKNKKLSDLEKNRNFKLSGGMTITKPRHKIEKKVTMKGFNAHTANKKLPRISSELEE